MHLATYIPTFLAESGALVAPLLGGAEPSALVQPDFGTIVWTWVTFGALCLTLLIVAWKPINKSLAEREDRIGGQVKRAEEAHAKAEALVVEYTAKLDEVKTEAQAIIAEGKADAEKLRQKIEAEARTEADRLMAGAVRDVTLAKEAALAELRQTTADLAVEMAARSIGRVLSPDDQTRLREECLTELAGGAGA
jgi:F-type H+-transporting ATPase subunit b